MAMYWTEVSPSMVSVLTSPNSDDAKTAATSTTNIRHKVAPRRNMSARFRWNKKSELLHSHDITHAMMLTVARLTKSV